MDERLSCDSLAGRVGVPFIKGLGFKALALAYYFDTSSCRYTDIRTYSRDEISLFSRITSARSVGRSTFRRTYARRSSSNIGGISSLRFLTSKSSSRTVYPSFYVFNVSYSSASLLRVVGSAITPRRNAIYSSYLIKIVLFRAHAEAAMFRRYIATVAIRYL